MADNSNHSSAALSAIRYLINEYGSIEKIPPTLLAKNGFKNAEDVKQALNWSNTLTGQSKSTTAQGNAVAPNLLKDVGKGILNIGLANVAGIANSVGGRSGLPPMPSNALAIDPVYSANGTAPSAATAANKDDYAAQYGPGSPGSGLQDVTPIPGGVQYGMPGGSTLGAPHQAGPQGDSGSDPTGSDAPNWLDYLSGYGKGATYAPIPKAPAPVQFQLNDFTDKASGMAAKAYSPAFQAIGEAEAQAQTNYAMADAIVGGVYKDLGTTIGANNDALDVKYDKTKAGMQADTTAAQSGISDVYGAVQKQAIQQAAASGLGQYATSGAMNKNSNDQLAFQSGQLAQQGLSNTNALDEYKQSSDTYGTGLQNASATQGAFSRQQLASDLANTLSGYSQDRLNLSSDEAMKVLDLAQSLSTTDLGLQQANAGQQQQYYQNQLGAANAQNAQVTAGLQSDYQQRQDAYNAAYGQYKDQTDWSLQAQKELDDQAQAQAQLAAQTRGQDLTYNASIYGSDHSGSNSTQNLDPYSLFNNQVGGILTSGGQAPDPTKIKAYEDAIGLVLQKYSTQHVTTDSGTFLGDVMAFASQNNLDPDVARSVAYAAMGSGVATGVLGAKALGPLSTN